MRLTDLIPAYHGQHNPVIAGLASDSRKVQPGFLFAALPGVKQDGKTYIDEAVRNGAVAVLTDGRASVDGAVAAVSDNPRLSLALAASRFYGKQPAFAAAVTGTNGKTSVAHFARQLWQNNGLKAASIGTLGIHGPDIERSGTLTTPLTLELHAELAELAEIGVTHLAMEASSHGLEQYRLDGVDIKAAGFTNLTLDHLDYHGTMDAYREAKLRLFTDILRSDGTAVLNADSPDYEAFRDAAGERPVIDYGWKAQALKIERLTPLPHGQRMEFSVEGRLHITELRLVGDFMAMNALCALGFAIAGAGEDMHAIHNFALGLSELRGVPGRLQLIPGHEKGAVYVDYAHTPDALDNVLRALRPHTQGRLLAVFGCGGDRDRSKRPLMGRIARQKADVVIVTDDNPRSEDPATIRKQILEGAGDDALEIGDRKTAIAEAISMMGEGDVLVIAGKGHEQGQVINGKVHPFNDAGEAASAILANAGKRL